VAAGPGLAPRVSTLRARQRLAPGVAFLPIVSRPDGGTTPWGDAAPHLVA